MVQIRRLPPLSRIESVGLSDESDPKRVQVTIQYTDRIGVLRELLLPGPQALRLADALDDLRDRLPKAQGGAQA